MSISIITTAALPSLTGTSINPLLRAAYLSRDHEVELVLPVCVNRHQTGSYKFGDEAAIAAASRDYLSRSLPNNAWRSENLTFGFYDAIYKPITKSLYPKRDIRNYPFSGDTLILEDPIQLLSIPSMLPDPRQTMGKSLRDKYETVIGINHTNNFYVLPIIFSNPLQCKIVTWGLKFLGSRILNHQCDFEINLSGAIPQLHDVSYTENVNGVHSQFFNRHWRSEPRRHLSENYYVGKIIPLKRVNILLDWAVEQGFKLHVYGKVAEVPDQLPKHLRDEFYCVLRRAHEIFETVDNVDFHRETTQPFVDLADHKTFINPSLSEVLCTTTAEALAMGKFAVMPDHPSNDFFKRFRNARFYHSDAEAIQLVRDLESVQPEVDPALHELSWERGCDRLLAVTSHYTENVRNVARQPSWAASQIPS
ncbi:MAG: hypothetical protein ACFCA4_04505 [Cyanophyceae cyanobacterium]